MKQELHFSSTHTAILVSVLVAAEMKQMFKKSEKKIMTLRSLLLFLHWFIFQTEPPKT